MDLKAAVYGRHSVREYTSEPVPEEMIKRLIEAACQAPSAADAQPWSFTVVRNQTLLGNISNAAKSHMLHGMAADAGQSRFHKMLSDPNFHIFYHAPALVLISAISATGGSDWVVEDCALAAQNLMLTAHASGLGSCWIGFAERWLGTPAGKAMLDLPADHIPVAPIIIGWPAATASPVLRREPKIRWIG